MENNECYVGDGGYYNGGQWAETPTGHNNAEQKMYALARAHHETVNSQHRHGTMFHAIANIMQLSIMDEQPLFQVDYDERQYSRV